MPPTREVRKKPILIHSGDSLVSAGVGGGGGRSLSYARDVWQDCTLALQETGPQTSTSVAIHIAASL
jgi:hypothetical protein